MTAKMIDGMLTAKLVIGHITQMVEYQAENLKVIGSNPIVPNMIKHPEFGAVAQLGEHLFCKQEVAGSMPVSST